MSITLKFIDQIIKGGISLIFPPICIGCDEKLDNLNEVFCEKCWNSLIPLKQDFIDKKTIPDNLEFVLAIWLFDDLFQKIIHTLKYQMHPSIGSKMGKLIGEKLFIDFELYKKNTVIIPIPLHPIKLRERGYNQAELIGKSISVATSIPILDILKRKKITKTQTKMNREQRMKNMENAFDINITINSNISRAILVDDVFTTGATMNCAAKVLKKNGIKEVIGLAAAMPE